MTTDNSAASLVVGIWTILDITNESESVWEGNESQIGDLKPAGKIYAPFGKYLCTWCILDLFCDILGQFGPKNAI